MIRLMRNRTPAFIIFVGEFCIFFTGALGPAAFASDSQGTPRANVGEAVVASGPKVAIYRNPNASDKTDNIFFGRATIIGKSGASWVQIADGWVRATDIVPQRVADTFFSRPVGAEADPFTRAGRALSWHLNGKQEQATEEARAAFDAAPQLPYAAFVLGVICESKDDRHGAIRHFSHAIESEPCLVDAYRRRAYIYAARRDAKAFEDFDVAMRRCPDSLQTKATHAIIRLGKDPDSERMIENAVEELAQLFKQAPDAGIAHAYELGLLRRCSLRHKQGDEARALTDADKAVSLRQSPRAILERGMCRQQLNDMPGAIRDFAMAISLYPEYVYAHQAHGLALYMSGDWQGARESLTKAISLGCNDRTAFLFRGLVTCDDEPRAA